MACTVCSMASALVFCPACDLQLCGPCGSVRHQKGSLVKHSVQFLSASYNQGSANYSDTCAYCGSRKSVSFCEQCDMQFCTQCAQEFHRLGSAVHHALRYRNTGHVGPPDEPPPPPPPIIPPGIHPQQLLPQKLARNVAPNQNLSPSNRERQSNAAMLKIKDVITLKLLAFGISVSTKELLQRSKKNEKNPEDNVFISFNCEAQIISIYQTKPKSKNSEKVNRMRMSRSFGSLKCAVADHIESKKLSLQFLNSRYTYDCLTVTSAECKQIIAVSNQIEKLENTEFNEKNVVDQTVFATYAFKRGKIRWSSRWLVLRNYELEVHRSRELCQQGEPPINQIDLSGAPVDVAGPKQLVVVVPERNFVFKLGSEAERNILLTLLADAATSEVWGTKEPNFCVSMPIKITLDEVAVAAANLREPAARSHRKSAQDRRSEPSANGRTFESDDEESDGSDSEPVSPSVGSPLHTSIRQNRGSSSSFNNSEILKSSYPLPRSIQDSWDMKPSNSGGRASILLKHHPQQRKGSGSVSVMGMIDRNSQLKEFEKALHVAPKMSSPATTNTQFEGLVSKMTKQEKVSTKIHFIEESDLESKEHFQPPPSDPVYTVFWLMDTIYRSMSSGAYFSHRLHVSRQIWRQRGAKFTAYDLKLDAFESVKKSLEGAVMEKFGSDNCLSMLVLCENELRQIQNQLSQHLAHVHAPKKHKTLPRSKLGRFGKSIKVISHSMAKGVTRATTRGQKIFDNTEYINLVKDICEQCQILKSWLDELENYQNPSSDLVETGRWIREIAEFLNVLAKIIIVDMKFCLTRYMKHCDKSLY